MSTAFLLVAIGALLLLATIFVDREGGRRVVVLPLLAGAGLVLVLVLVNIAADRAGYYPNSHALRLMKGMELQLHKALADPHVERIILVEGSSYSARGLDGAMLGRLLTRRTGRKTVVLQMTLDGANHFERSWVLERVLARMTPEQERRLQGLELTLLMEIQRGYDHSPLNGFMRNLGTSRAYAYMSPGNALDGLRAVGSVGDAAPQPVRTVLPHVLSHALVNGMSVGMAYRGVTLDEVAPIPGYQPLRKRKRRYRYKGGMAEVLEQARQPGRGAAAAAIPSWLERIRVPRYRRILGDLIDREAWYAVPSTEVADLQYVEAFCDRQPADAICIRYSDPRLLRRLDRLPDWSDARHMRVSGAEKFTRWFARRYLRDIARSESR